MDKTSFEYELCRRFGAVYKRNMMHLLEVEQDSMTLEKVHKLENHITRMAATLEATTLKSLVEGVTERLVGGTEVVEAPMEFPEIHVDTNNSEELIAKIEAEVKKISTLRCLLNEFEDSKAEYLSRDLTILDREETV
jgi:hypothetical protein